MNFGFSISTPRSINLDEADFSPFRQLVEKVPSYKGCIGCGGCTATCSAGHFVDFNIRQTHTLFRRGQYDPHPDDHSRNNLNQCMLCGKCMLVCPQSVNLRGLIIEMRKILMNKTTV